MKIATTINKYRKQGNSYLNSQNLAAEEIIIRKIASSPISNIITIKGGMIMYNLSKNKRRVTRDIDFDLLRYPIDDNSIRLLISQLNTINDGVHATIKGEIEQLHQEDYQGRRVHLLLKDNNGDELTIKLDIGVHTYHAITQRIIIFEYSDNEFFSLKANPCEQVFSEKLISLIKLGVNSTRYKDLYDLYYLINNNLLDIGKVREILKLFISMSNSRIGDLNDITLSIEETLNDEFYIEEATKTKHSWIDVDYNTVKETIIGFVNKL